MWRRIFQVALVIILIFSACAIREKLPGRCEPARVYVQEGIEHIHPSWPRSALIDSYHRVGPELACKAMEGREIWLYVHRDKPLACPRHGRHFGSCHFTFGDSVHQIEIDLNDVRKSGAENVYEVIHHEMMHAILTSLGIPSPEHHYLMEDFYINTDGRRSIEYK